MYVFLFCNTKEGIHLNRNEGVDCNRRILAIVDDYPNRQTIPYLRSIANIFRFETMRITFILSKQMS